MFGVFDDCESFGNPTFRSSDDLAELFARELFSGLEFREVVRLLAWWHVVPEEVFVRSDLVEFCFVGRDDGCGDCFSPQFFARKESSVSGRDLEFGPAFCDGDRVNQSGFSDRVSQVGQFVWVHCRAHWVAWWNDLSEWNLCGAVHGDSWIFSVFHREESKSRREMSPGSSEASVSMFGGVLTWGSSSCLLVVIYAKSQTWVR